MSNLSPYLANKLARWIAGNDMPAAPATVYVGLYNGSPVAAGVEVGGDITGGADRIAISLDAVPDDGVDNVVASDALADFGASASATQVDVTHVTLHDAVTAGNILTIKTLAVPREVQQNDQVRVQSGDYELTIVKFA